MDFSYARVKRLLFDKYQGLPWFREVLLYTMKRYHSIENRLIETFRYVDCSNMNCGVFSYEYASILRDCGSVFGSIMDRLVRETTPKKPSNEYDMRDYRKWLIKEINEIHLLSVGINYPLERKYLLPFKELDREDGRLEWWIAYNNIKHSDVDNFRDGNLRNAFNSLGALAILFAVMDANNGSEIRVFEEIGFVKPEHFVEAFLFG